ncbi:MAG: chemotaxis protein CheW [Gammaproteobacteria bacterium]|nr:chemotaxis protein CheW [Gammaproteobacteria bacterium]
MNNVQIAETEINLEAGSEGQFLTFIMANEEYGVDILRVQEIRGWDNVTPIPNTPSYIKGVINLRGTIVPIIDLRERFGLEKMEYDATTVVIVLKVVSAEKERIMGIVVDAVSDVYNVGEDEMKSPPDFGSVVSIDFVKGLVAIEEKMLIILEIDDMLNSGDLVIAESVAQ